jgi:RimJ/RimL family protein N-acetyltransferase
VAAGPRATAPVPARIAEMAVEELEERHADALRDLLERCTDYFELVFGHPPGPAERQSVFIALPEGKAYDDKFTFVFVFQERLVGLIDLIRDHPEPGEWWLGMLLLDPSQRSLGLGSESYCAFERWAAASGARALNVSVAGINTGALRFWRRLGFAEVDRRRAVRLGVRVDDLVVLRKEL